jgi:RimJ/RimL family protein N-acetyltransferase
VTAQPRRAVDADAILQTERLRLRRWRDSDLPTMAAWSADPRFMRHMGRGPLSWDESVAGFARVQRHWDEHGFGLLAVEDRASGALIGRAGVQFHRLWSADPEVGWGLDPAWWGRGLATEAGGACVRWAFETLGFSRLVSITTPDNVASQRVMAKLGFRLLQELADPLLGISLLVHVLNHMDRAPASA